MKKAPPRAKGRWDARYQPCSPGIPGLESLNAGVRRALQYRARSSGAMFAPLFPPVFTCPGSLGDERKALLFPSSPLFNYIPFSYFVKRENYLFVHVDGINAIIMGSISSLPKSIAKDNTIFDAPEYAEKFPAGPTSFPSPGPTLLKHVTVAVMFVSRSMGSNRLISANAAHIQITYNVK